MSTVSIKAEELTFGIEIETIAPQSCAMYHGLTVGQHGRGVQIPYLPAGWKADKDGSIQAGGDIQCEVVSPILRGEAGIAQVLAVAGELADKGHRVNSSCGVHVHVGWKREWPEAALNRLVEIVGWAEKALYATTGTKNREASCWCKSLRAHGNPAAAKTAASRDRYHGLNLTNLSFVSFGKNTVEFRFFSGSLSAKKLIGWAMLCLGLVEHALRSEKKLKFIPAEYHRIKGANRVGRNEVERVARVLGWHDVLWAGHKNDYHYGWIPNPYKPSEIKAEMVRLANKYDGYAAQ